MYDVFLGIIVISLIAGMVMTYFGYKDTGGVLISSVLGIFVSFFVASGLLIVLAIYLKGYAQGFSLIVGFGLLVAAPALVLKCIDKKKRG
jgi:uncharacterized membrane protein